MQDKSNSKLSKRNTLPGNFFLAVYAYILFYAVCIPESHAQQQDGVEKAVQTLNDIFKMTSYLKGLTAKSAVLVRAGDEVDLPELDEEMKAGETITIEPGRDPTVVHPEEGRYVRVGYEALTRYGNERVDYIDLFLSETIKIGPNMLVGVQYVMPKGMGNHNTGHLRVASKGSVKLQLPPYYRGSLILTVEESIFKRVPGTKKLKVLKGSGFISQITSKQEVLNVSKQGVSNVSDFKMQIVFGHRSSTKDLTYKQGQIKKIAANELKEIAHVERVAELPPDMGKGETNKYVNGETFLRIGAKSVVRLDIRNSRGERLKSGEQYDPNEHTRYFDAFYPETIELGPDTIVPLEWKMSAGSTLMVDAQITVTGGDVRFYYSQDMIGRAIVSGPKGATLKRVSDDPRKIKVITGTAYIGRIVRFEPSH